MRCWVLACALVAPAAVCVEAAETPNLIEAGASQNHFYIEPSYDGTAIVLFGSVDRERLKGRTFDIAITVRGPVKAITIWKKGRKAGLWVNSESLTFEGVPNFYAVLSTRPIAEIAPREERRPHEIGLDALSLPMKTEGDMRTQPQAPEEFQTALIRLKQSSKLFVEEYTAVEFFGASLFRAKVFLPASAGPGLYRANFYVLENGKVVGEATAHIRLNKIGIEAALSSAAANHPWLYGIMAVFMAAAIGSGASLFLRRA